MIIYEGHINCFFMFFTVNVLKHFCASYKNVTNLQSNVYIRQKISKILEMEPFVIDSTSLEIIQEYWMEDIILVQKLLQLEIDEGFIGLLDGIGTCINIFQNPGVTIQEGHFCEVSGFCEVTKPMHLINPFFTFTQSFFISRENYC